MTARVLIIELCEIIKNIIMPTPAVYSEAYKDYRMMGQGEYKKNETKGL